MNNDTESDINIVEYLHLNMNEYTYLSTLDFKEDGYFSNSPIDLLVFVQLGSSSYTYSNRIL